MIPQKNILNNYISNEYNYINIEHFHPSSSSYVYYNNKHILNTRFINYTYMDNNVIRQQKVLNSLNICSELNTNLIPINFNLMNDGNVNNAKMFRMRLFFKFVPNFYKEQLWIATGCKANWKGRLREHYSQ